MYPLRVARPPNELLSAGSGGQLRLAPTPYHWRNKMSEEIEDIWKECEAEIEANHKMLANMQLGFEEAIGNLAALKTLSDSSIEETVKNS